MGRIALFKIVLRFGDIKAVRSSATKIVSLELADFMMHADFEMHSKHET